MSIELQEKTEMDKFSSIRIDNFFKMYRNEKGMKNFPKFKIFKGANEISLQNDTFLISGGTPLDRYNLTTKLLSVLDWEYPHFGKIGVWPAGYPRCGETRKMRKKAGLTQGSVLRWDNPKHFMNENFR